MPWESKTVETIREEFVAKALIDGCNFSRLCREYHISRTTGYEWVNRYKDGYDLKDRSHAPRNRPHKTSAYAYSMQSYMNGRSVYCVITDRYGNQVQTEPVTLYVIK